MAALHLNLVLLLGLFALTSARRVSLGKISFTGVGVPEGDAINTHTAFSELKLNGVTHKVQFEKLLESGKTYPSFTPGKNYTCCEILDINGTPLTVADDPDAAPELAADFDRTSIFTKWGKIWMITQNEDNYGNIYLAELSQDKKTGKLTILKIKSLNLGPIHGTSRPCSGSFTPWGTHISAEEDVPEARDHPITSSSALIKQAVVNRLPSWEEANPYWYGFNVEVSVTNGNGAYAIGKRYAMGRMYHETALVLPDRKTVISTDDQGSGGILTMFIADKIKNLKKGKLYAATMKQISDKDGGEFTIQWVNLNPTKQSIDEKMIKDAVEGPNPLKFSDIFETAEVVYINGTNPRAMDLSQLPAGFKVIKTSGTKLEWLKLKPGMGAYAAALETNRMADYMGATNEYTKIEGLTYDSLSNSVFLAATAVRRSMTDAPLTWDYGGPNVIRLPETRPGTIFKMRLGRATGIPSSFVPVSFKGLLSGFGYNSSGGPNSVPQDSIASPDNIDIMVKYRVILIAEDAGDQHVNNYMWAYDLREKTLTRLFASSIEAEVTSPFYFPNIRQFSYITATQQHPLIATGEPAIVGYWTLPRE